MATDAGDVGQKVQPGTPHVPGIEGFVQDMFKPAEKNPPSVCPSEQGLDVEEPKVRALKQTIVAETCKDIGANSDFSAKSQEDLRKLFDIYKQAGFSQPNIEDAMKDLSDTVTDKLRQDYPDSRPGVFAYEKGTNGFAMGVAYEGTQPAGARLSFVMGEFSDTANGACPIADNPILEDPKVRERINNVADETRKDLEQAHALMPKTEDDWRDLYKIYKEAGLAPEQIYIDFREAEERINKQMYTDSGPYPVMLMSKTANGLFLKYDFRRETSSAQPPQPIRIDS